MTAYSIPLKKVRDRADFFLHVAQLACKEPMLTKHGFHLAEHFAQFTAEAYFLVNSAYKGQRMYPETRYTQFPKIAAISTVVINTLNPLRPFDLEPPLPVICQYANPMFAMRCGCHIIDFPLKTRNFEELSRTYDGMRHLQLPSLVPYLHDIRAGSRGIGDPFDIDLTAEEIRTVENYITIFSTLEEVGKLMRETAVD